MAMATLGAIAAVASASPRKDEEEDEGTSPQVGFAGARPRQERTDTWPAGDADPGQLEATLLDAGPIDLDGLEAEEPTVGMFYAGTRGDTLLGEGPKSIVCRALYSAAAEAAAWANDSDPHAFARSIASHPHRRVLYANLITAGCVYNDLFFGTWGYCPRDFVGPHGRALCLKAVHADVRAALVAGVRPVRSLAMGTPVDRGTGLAVEETREARPEARARPYFWLPMINLELLYTERQITTRGCVWEGSTLPCSEPPREVWRLIGAPV